MNKIEKDKWVAVALICCGLNLIRTVYELKVFEDELKSIRHDVEVVKTRINK